MVSRAAVLHLLRDRDRVRLAILHGHILQASRERVHPSDQVQLPADLPIFDKGNDRSIRTISCDQSRCDASGAEDNYNLRVQLRSRFHGC